MKTKDERMALAEADFAGAAVAALDGGLELRKCSPMHYQLQRPGGWLINLYPTNRRVYADPKRGRAPWLGLPTDRDWRLMDCVKAALDPANAPKPKPAKPTAAEVAATTDSDWTTPCTSCRATPTVVFVYATHRENSGLCGPCLTGEADTAMGGM